MAAGVQRFVFVSSLSAREPGLSAYGASKRARREAGQGQRARLDDRAPAGDLRPARPRACSSCSAPPNGAWCRLPPGRPRPRCSMSTISRGCCWRWCRAARRDLDTHASSPTTARAAAGATTSSPAAIGWAVGRRPRVLGLSRRTHGTRRQGSTGCCAAPRAKLTLDRVGYMSHPDWVVGPARARPRVWRPRDRHARGAEGDRAWYREQGWL